MPRNPSCTNCELSKGSISHVSHICTWGEHRLSNGDPASPARPKPRVFILGEAPGYNEDVQGRPFVGQSWTLLKSALDAADLEEDSFYITNVAKCFPAGKLPRTAIKGCYDYLEEEIADLKPEYILALGNTAIQRLIGKGKITELAGKEIWSDKYNCWIVPALHPAAILRNMGAHAGWQADIKHFADLIKGKLKSKVEVEIHEINTDEKLQQLSSLIHKYPRFSFDFEATPVPWWHKDWSPYSISFSFDGHHSFVIPLQHPDCSPLGESATERLAWMRLVRGWARTGFTYSLFTEPDVRKVAHNRMYDTLAWWRTFGYQINTTDCSMIATHLLEENEPKGLKWQGRTKLGWEDWDIDARQLHPWPKTRDYNGIDSASTWLLMFEHYEPSLKDRELWRYYQNLCMKDAAWIERMVWRGMPVDNYRLDANLIDARTASSLAALDIPVENPGSSQQVAKWLYDELHLPILKLTPGGAPSTDEDTINRLALLGYEAPKKVLTFRGHEKNIHTYYEPISKMIEQSFDHRLHPDIRMAAVETGRHSSFMHTIPRDSTVRSIINTTDPDWELVELDESQLEARLSAWSAAGRPPAWDRIDWSRAHMLEAFYNKTDVYKLMAGEALGKRPELVTKDERQEIGKVPVLAMLYKISWRGLQAYAWKSMQLIWSDGFAQHVWQTFHKLFPEFQKWHLEEEDKISARGWTRTVLGRVRHLPDAMSLDPKTRMEAVRSGINAPVQGLGSDITQAAGIIVDLKIDSNQARIIHEVHDALILEILRDLIPSLVPVIKNYMNLAPRALENLGLKIPEGLLFVEEKIGPWGKGVSLEEYLTKLAPV